MSDATIVDDDRSVLLSEEALVGGQTKCSAHNVVVGGALSKAAVAAERSCACSRNDSAKPHRMAGSDRKSGSVGNALASLEAKDTLTVQLDHSAADQNSMTWNHVARRKLMRPLAHRRQNDVR